jgi:hypothetical protein
MQIKNNFKFKNLYYWFWLIFPLGYLAIYYSLIILDKLFLWDKECGIFTGCKTVPILLAEGLSMLVGLAVIGIIKLIDLFIEIPKFIQIDMFLLNLIILFLFGLFLNIFFWVITKFWPDK